MNLTERFTLTQIILSITSTSNNLYSCRADSEGTDAIENSFAEHQNSQSDIKRKHADINDPSQPNGNLNQTEIDSAVGSIL